VVRRECRGLWGFHHGQGKAYFRQIAIFDDKFLPQFETQRSSLPPY
jgi:hypothetical protein